jgi:hypothetical protein
MKIRFNLGLLILICFSLIVWAIIGRALGWW